MSRERPQGWYPLLLATASIGIANSVVFPLLSDLQDAYGFSSGSLGIIAGSGFLVGLVGQIVLAPLADRGHATRLLLAGLSMAVLGSVLFASASSLGWLIVARCVVGLSNSLFLPAARAIVISVSEHDIAKRLGTLSGVELAGFVTGPVVGGLLAGPFGIRVPFLVAGLVPLGGALLLLGRHLPEPPTVDSNRLAFDLLRLPGIRAGILMAMALFLPVGFYDATLDRYLTDLGAHNWLIGLSYMAYGLPFAVLSTTGGRLADQKGALRMAAMSALLVAPLTWVYGFIGSAGAIVALSAVEGMVQALGVPAAGAMVAHAAPRGRAAAAQGLSGASSLLLGATSAYVAGALYGALGPVWMFSIAASGVVVFTALAASQQRRAIS